MLSRYGARDRIWTGDLSLTKEVLYLLSYVGTQPFLDLPFRIDKKKEIDNLILRLNCLPELWSWRSDLNRWPADYKSAALPTELRQR